MNSNNPSGHPQPSLLKDSQTDPTGGHSTAYLKKVVEGALFASGQTLDLTALLHLFDEHERPDRTFLSSLVGELQSEYETRGISLVEVAGGYRFQTHVELGERLSPLWAEKPARYSRALMETLALIVYRQPITRAEIESVRGVAVSSNIIRTLLERDWIRVAGHRETPGQPAIYASTKQFLNDFNLKHLNELPSLSDIEDRTDLPQPFGADPESAQALPNADQAAQSFSAVIDDMREQTHEHAVLDEIDERLRHDFSEADELNAQFETRMTKPETQVDEANDSESLDTHDAEHIDKESDEKSLASLSINKPDSADTPESEREPANQNALPQTPMSEEEQWLLIQTKLAQQQALLDAREADQTSKDEDNE